MRAEPTDAWVSFYSLERASTGLILKLDRVAWHSPGVLVVEIRYRVRRAAINGRPGVATRARRTKVPDANAANIFTVLNTKLHRGIDSAAFFWAINLNTATVLAAIDARIVVFVRYPPITVSWDGSTI